jgi:hypothetical protein
VLQVVDLFFWRVERSQVSVEGAVLRDHLVRGAGRGDRGLDLPVVADDPRVLLGFADLLVVMAATCRGSKSWKTSLKAGQCDSTVGQFSPAWKIALVSCSK